MLLPRPPGDVIEAAQIVVQQHARGVVIETLLLCQHPTGVQLNVQMTPAIHLMNALAHGQNDRVFSHGSTQHDFSRILSSFIHEASQDIL